MAKGACGGFPWRSTEQAVQANARTKVRNRIASRRKNEADSIDVQKRLEEQRKARDAARARMRRDIAKRSKHNKKPSRNAPVSIMVPPKFADALGLNDPSMDKEVIFLNAPLTDHENQTSMSTETQKNDDVSIDIDLSFDDDKTFVPKRQR